MTTPETLILLASPALSSKFWDAQEALAEKAGDEPLADRICRAHQAMDFAARALFQAGWASSDVLMERKASALTAILAWALTAPDQGATEMFSQDPSLKLWTKKLPELRIYRADGTFHVFQAPSLKVSFLDFLQAFERLANDGKTPFTLDGI